MTNTNNLIALPLKQTEGVPFFASTIVEHVASTSDTTHPDVIEQDAKIVSQQRNRLVKVFNNGSVDGDTLLQLTAYYAQLTYIITKLPNDIIYFPWFPLFASASAAPVVGAFDSTAALAISIASLQFERLATLYNIAAVHSILATATKRSDEAAMKSSIAGFQNAAGVLSHLLNLLPLLTTTTNNGNDEDTGDRPLSPDFTTETIEALRDLCLAQAQEVFWQNAVLGKSVKCWILDSLSAFFNEADPAFIADHLPGRLKNGTISKLAIQVSLYYSSALSLAQKVKLKESGSWSFPEALLSYMAIKAGHFNAVAQYRKSIDDLGANRYGDEIGRLEVAIAAVKKALAVSKRGVAETVVRDLKSLQTVLIDNLTRATKDNDLIYLATPTPLSDLPIITPANMARSTTSPELISPLDHLQVGKLGKPLFEGLVPWQVHAAMKLYEDRRESFRKEELSDLQLRLDSLTAQTMQELNLPSAIEAVLQPTTLPVSLLDKSREVRTEGGTERIRSTMQDVRKVARVNQKLLNESLALLSQEALEDAQFVAQHSSGSTTVPRDPSSVAQVELKTRADNLSGVMNAAGQSDQLVRSKFGEWEAQMELLSADESQLHNHIAQMCSVATTSTTSIASSSESSSKSSHAESMQSKAIRRLGSLIDDLSDLRTTRQTILDNFRRVIEHDDPSILKSLEKEANDRLKKEGKVLMSDFEKVFEKGLSRFNDLKEEMLENEARTEDLIGELKTAHTSFVEARRTDPALTHRIQILQDLDAAYHKYKEILNNLQEGLGFYADLARLLTELRDATKEFVRIRSDEAVRIGETLRTRMQELSLQSQPAELEEPKRRISPRKKSTVPAAAAVGASPATNIPTKPSTGNSHGDTSILSRDNGGTYKKEWDPSMGIRFG